MQHRCNLAAKESGLECSRVNSDDFPVLVSGHCVIIACKMTELSNESASNFALSLNIHSSVETIPMIQKAVTRSNWQLAASLQQHACSCITSHVEFFGKTWNHPGDSVPLQPRFGTLWLLAFPQTKIPRLKF